MSATDEQAENGKQMFHEQIIKIMNQDNEHYQSQEYLNFEQFYYFLYVALHVCSEFNATKKHKIDKEIKEKVNQELTIMSVMWLS